LLVSLDVISFLSAEIVLVVAALAIFMGGAFSASNKLWASLALGAILFAAASLWSCGGNERYLQHTASRMVQPNGPGSQVLESTVARQIAAFAATGPVVADPLSTYGRWFALCAGAVMVLMAWRPLVDGGTPEYLGSLLLIIAGLMLVASAANLVMLFVGLELISIPTYILLSLGRRDPAGQEAAAKYFFLSVLSSGIFLYGVSFLYGTTGTMQIAGALHPPVAASEFGLILSKMAMVLIVAGLCFRVTAVPFHFYAPDVFQGTIQANAALLSVLPKAAGLIALVRLVVVGMPDIGPYAWKIFLAISILTMTLGNVLALWQDNVRRLFAYSSVANAGYMLIGLAVGLAPGTAGGFWDGLGATFFYLCVYAAATLGTFAVFAYLGRERQQIESVEELAGLGRTHPVMAAALAVCMFSLAGLPPVAGIWGKLLLFGSALNVESASGGPLRPWFIALAVIGVLNAAVAAYYYLRLVSLMYFRAPLAAPKAEGGTGAYVAALICSLAVLVLFFYPGPLIKGCAEAGQGRATGAGVSAKETADGQQHEVGTRVQRSVIADLKSQISNL
jgi:NADH-quinone oxidoreductase subunit N